MFKSARKYSGLDDFYGTSSTNSLYGWSAIEDRINETDKVYRDWQLNSWHFTSDHEETQYLINEVYDTIEIMRSSVSTYIMGNFNASIQSSSAAVEKIGNVILYWILTAGRHLKRLAPFKTTGFPSTRSMEPDTTINAGIVC